MYHFNSYFYAIISLLLLLFFEYHAFESNIENHDIISKDLKLFDELNSFNGIKKRSVSKKKSNSKKKTKNDKSKSKHSKSKSKSKNSKTKTKSKGSKTTKKSKDSNSKKKKPQKKKHPFEKNITRLYEDINNLRMKFGSKNLTVKSSMAKEAQKFTDKFSSKGYWSRIDKKYGFTITISGISDGIDPLYTWTLDANGIDYNSEASIASFIYFTQLVWYKTTHIGCGISKNIRSFYVVCLFYPRGNIRGQYKANVRRPLDNVHSRTYNHYFRRSLILDQD